MKTIAIFIDDARREIEDLMDSLKAEFSSLAPFTVVRTFNDPPTDVLPGDNSVSLEIAFLDALSIDDNAADEAKYGAMSDLFMVDLNWDGDREDRRGLGFSRRLVASGISKDRVTIITNNTTIAAEMDMGEWGRSFDSCSKGNVARLAGILYNAMNRPFRASLPEANLINAFIHGGASTTPGLELLDPRRSAIDCFFHRGRPKPTKRDVIDACKLLSEQAKLKLEASWMTKALTTGLASKADSDNVNASDLPDDCERSALEASALECATDETLKTDKALKESVETAQSLLPANWSLKDLLFPEVRSEPGRPFRVFVEAAIAKFPAFALQLVAADIPAVVNPLVGDTVKGAVPLSWFRSFDDQWLGDLARHFMENKCCEPLQWATVNTNVPNHACVMFWHRGKGFPHETELLKCAQKILQVAVEFSHIFIGSACQDGSKFLIEVQPHRSVRKIPSLKVHFGSTSFDFSQWNNGSAYLFAVPGSV